MLIYLLGLLCLFANSFANNKQTLMTLTGNLTSLSNNAIIKAGPIHGHGRKKPHKPVRPLIPLKPIEPSRPFEPIQPLQPLGPRKPAKPDRSTRPSRPVRPIKPPIVKPTAPLTLKKLGESSAKPHPYTEYQLGGCKIRLIIQDILQEPADAIVNAANTGCLGGGGIDGIISRAGGEDPTGIAPDGQRQHTTLYDLRYALPKSANGRCPEKESRITRGGWLNYNYNDPRIGNHRPRGRYKYVIHATGPRCGNFVGDLEKEAVATTYLNALERVNAFNIEPKDPSFEEFALINTTDLGTNYQIRSLSFPTISSGIFGCKVVDTVDSIVNTVLAYVKGEKDLTVKQINFVFWDPGNPSKGESDYNIYKKTFDKHINK